MRTSLEDEVTSFAYGPVIGFLSPAEGMLITLGYNIQRVFATATLPQRATPTRGHFLPRRG